MHKIDINTPDPGYEPFPVSIMNRYTREVSSFDPLEGRPAAIAYSLNKAGCIRIRLVHRQLPSFVITTLQDWTRQDFGRYELKWDGRDRSGNLADNRKVFVLFEAKDQGRGRGHAGHDPASCVDPGLSVEAQSAKLSHDTGLVEICTSFRENAAGSIVHGDCEVRYYVDFELVKTDRPGMGSSNFRCMLDTGRLTPGEHLVSVNVDDLRDHIGSGSVRIRVGR